jgi:hypothetical protein
MPEGDQWQVGAFGAGDLGEPIDVGGHVVPGARARLSEFAGFGGVPVSAQVESVGDAALGCQEAGQPVVSGTVFADAVGDLRSGPRTDPTGRQPLSNEYWSLIDL